MKQFFDKVRAAFGALTRNQVAGLNALLDASKNLPEKHRAYILATAWHETGPEDTVLHMTPRREMWGPTPAQLRYEGRADLGNTEPGDGKRFMGRGYCQITGRRNYKLASGIVGTDLVAHPDLALLPNIAAKIIVDGMVRGWFTGKSMADYGSDYVAMRRVVNGTDKAELIAGYAEKFEAALRALPQPVADLPPLPVPIPVEAPGAAPDSIEVRLAAILRRIADELDPRRADPGNT